MDDLIYDKQFNTIVINVTIKQNIKTIYRLILNPGIKEIEVINVTTKQHQEWIYNPMSSLYMEALDSHVINVNVKQLRRPI